MLSYGPHAAAIASVKPLHCERHIVCRERLFKR